MPPEFHLDPTQIDFSQVVADRDGIAQVNLQRFEMAQLTAIVVLDFQTQIIAGYKDVEPDEFWVRGHLPGLPLFPGVLQCETAAQLCSYYLGSSKLFDVEFMGFGGLENVRFRAPVRPGDRFVVIGKALRLTRRMSTFSVQGFVGSTMAFQAEIQGIPLDLKALRTVKDS